MTNYEQFIAGKATSDIECGFDPQEMGRRFVGAELKRSYWDLAKRNLSQAREIKASGLFNDEDMECA